MQRPEAVNAVQYVSGLYLPPLHLVADAAAKQPAAGQAAAPSVFESMLPAFAAMAVFFYIFILRPQRNKDQQFRAMIDNLKETDRVVTIGGIHGVVVNVQRDAKMITLRVDEATGTKIRVGTSAIAQVITDNDKHEKSG